MNDIKHSLDISLLARSDIAPAFDKSNVPIVFGADENYLPFLKVTINSILANTHDRNLDVLIFHDSLSIEAQEGLISSVPKQDNLSIRFLDVKNIVDATPVHFYDSKNHFSTAVFYKLFLPYVLPQYSKVLYLDIDLVVCDNIGALYDIDLNNNLLGGCKDIAFKDFILKQPGYVDFAKKYDFNDYDGYVNAGVLLFNCNAFREQITVDKLIDIAVKGAHYFLDQDALNFCCKGRIKEIHSRWNFLAIPGRIQSQAMHKNGDYKIVHYACSIKPWNHPEHIYAHLWWKHIDITEGVKLWRKIFNCENSIAIGEGACASVVIPIYNAELYLPMMLISLAAQTLQNIEILCVDDGSKDNSKAICEKFAKFDTRFRVISQPNSGAAIARNKGLEESKARWLFFADADDFCKPEMLEKMVQDGEKNQSDVVVAGRYLVDVRNDRFWEQSLPKSYVEHSQANCHTPDINIFRGLGDAPWNKLYLRDFIINENIIFHQTPPQDDVFFVLTALILAERICFEPHSFYYYRSNLSTSQMGTIDKQPINFLVALIEVHDQIPLDDFILQKQFYSTAVKSCFYNLFQRKTLDGMTQTFKAIQEYGLESLRFPNIKDEDIDFGIYKTAYVYTKNDVELVEVLRVQYQIISDHVKNIEISLDKKDARITELLSRIKDKDARIAELLDNWKLARTKNDSLSKKITDINKLFTEVKLKNEKLQTSLMALRKENRVLQQSCRIWKVMFFVCLIIVVEWFFFIYW